MKDSDSLTTCEWCSTLNDPNRMNCVLCDVQLGIPVLDDLPLKDLDGAMRSAYTRGGARLVAERLIDKRIPWRNQPIERQCIKFALAEQFPFLELVLIVDETNPTSNSYMGWRWPTTTLVSGVNLSFIRGAHVEQNFCSGGRKVGSRHEKRNPKRLGVNLHLPSADEMQGITVRVSLSAEIEGKFISTHPRVVQSTGK